MKTLLLSEIFPPKTGGSGRWFFEIYSRMPRDRFVIAAGTDPEQSSVDSTHALDLVRLPLTMSDWGLTSWAGLRGYSRAFRAVRRLVRERGIDRVHCGRCVPEGWIGLLLKRLYGIPFTCYVHGEDVNLSNSGQNDGVLSSRQLRWMTGQVLRNVDQVIANSHNSARILREQWNVPAERIDVLHPGVDTGQFSPARRSPEARRELGWGDRPVLLTVGRLQKRKGHDTVIRALPGLIQAVPDVLYAIAGDGEERGALERLAVDEGVEHHVQFMGRVSEQTLRNACQQADVSVLANRQVGTDIEGFGMVLLESQACGVPVVAGQSGGTAETMRPGETGYVIPCDSHDQLETLLIRMLLDRSSLLRMGRAARQWAVSEFDWSALSVRAARLFEITATGPGDTGPPRGDNLRHTLRNPDGMAGTAEDFIGSAAVGRHTSR